MLKEGRCKATISNPTGLDGSAAKPLSESIHKALVHKAAVATDENKLLRAEISDLHRLIDTLNDRAHVADIALEHVNGAFDALELPRQPQQREPVWRESEYTTLGSRTAALYPWQHASLRFTPLPRISPFLHAKRSSPRVEKRVARQHAGAGCEGCVGQR